MRHTQSYDIRHSVTESKRPPASLPATFQLSLKPNFCRLSLSLAPIFASWITILFRSKLNGISFASFISNFTKAILHVKYESLMSIEYDYYGRYCRVVEVIICKIVSMECSFWYFDRNVWIGIATSVMHAEWPASTSTLALVRDHFVNGDGAYLLKLDIVLLLWRAVPKIVSNWNVISFLGSFTAN